MMGYLCQTLGFCFFILSDGEFGKNSTFSHQSLSCILSLGFRIRNWRIFEFTVFRIAANSVIKRHETKQGKGGLFSNKHAEKTWSYFRFTLEFSFFLTSLFFCDFSNYSIPFLTATDRVNV